MQSKIDYPKELNAAQLEAVYSTEGPHLLIAGAGSGKTRVLVYRTAYLVEKGVPPESILLLTFTRRASREMLERSTEILDDRCHQVSGGTFHSFANTILRRYGRHVGLPVHFSIMDQDDAESAVNLVRTKLGLHKADKKFPKKETVFAIISRAVNKVVDVEAVVYEEYPHFLEWVEAIQRIQEGYVQYKRAMAVVDYDDLLVLLRDLLSQQETLRRQLSQFYRYIMVDEYQDTNKIQAQIVQLLATEHKNVTVVGDDAQSIYSFRGAHFRNIIDFPKLFPGAKVILLEENYRSAQPILDLTNQIIRSAGEKFEKALFSNKQGKELPVYVDTVDENSQSKYVIRRILELRSQGVPLKEIAVLFRSGWHSNDLEVQLASHRIPFVKYGGQKFVEAAHIKDVMGYLRVTQNPSDEVSWLRVLTLLPGIGTQTAAQIVKQLTAGPFVFQVEEKFLKKHAELGKLLQFFREAKEKNYSVPEVIKFFLGFYYPLLMDQYDDYDKRLNDLESLEQIAGRYSSLEEFLTDMTLEPLEKSAVDLARRRLDREDKLVLSTIHSAKGLEWHTVFLLYVAEGYLPSYRSLDNEDAVEEERRLFYVAATRAKERLYLLRPFMNRSPRAGMDSGTMYTRVSRFLEGGILQKYVRMESDSAALRYQQAAVRWEDEF